ncbi:MAG: hypothetical protein QXU60_04505 [Sulfolobales archaeon]
MSQVQIPIKIEVKRENAPELYKFIDLYLTPKRFMTVTEYQRLIGSWPGRLIDLVFRDTCDVIFEDEECPVDVDKIREEIFDALANSPELEQLTEELDVDWAGIDPRDNDIHVDDKIVIVPVLRFDDRKDEEYKIYLVVEKAVKWHEAP